MCAGSSCDFSESGGMNNVMSWMDKKEGFSWSQLSLFFFAVLGSLSIYQTSLGSNAIAAVQTVFDGLFQLDPINTTAQRELT